MLRIPRKSWASFLLLSLCLIQLGAVLLSAQQKPARDSTQAATPAIPIYLPPGGNASLMPAILASLREPSLFEAAQDVRSFSFRASFFSPVPVHEVAVRLVINDDGSGEITSAVSTGKDTEVRRTKNRVAKADIEKLLELVRKAEFWSTASTEQEPSDGKRGDGKPKAYALDGAWWMLEGVHDGSFHYVFRRNPGPGPVTEIGCYLARDLVTTEGTIPMARCGSQRRQPR